MTTLTAIDIFAPVMPGVIAAPCPFCGDPEPVWKYYLSKSLWRVRCQECDARGGKALNQEEAMFLWNKRTEGEKK